VSRPENGRDPQFVSHSQEALVGRIGTRGPGFFARGESASGGKSRRSDQWGPGFFRRSPFGKIPAVRQRCPRRGAQSRKRTGSAIRRPRTCITREQPTSVESPTNSSYLFYLINPTVAHQTALECNYIRSELRLS